MKKSNILLPWFLVLVLLAILVYIIIHPVTGSINIEWSEYIRLVVQTSIIAIVIFVLSALVMLELKQKK